VEIGKFLKILVEKWRSWKIGQKGKKWQKVGKNGGIS